MVRIAFGIAVSLALTWSCLLIVLAVLRPKGMNLAEAKRFTPDFIRLVRQLAADENLSTGVRRRLVLLTAYLALPFDLVPDFIPVLGYADDVIVIALVLRSVVKRAGATVIDRHWSGSPTGLSLVHRLAGL